MPIVKYKSQVTPQGGGQFRPSNLNVQLGGPAATASAISKNISGLIQNQIEEDRRYQEKEDQAAAKEGFMTFAEQSRDWWRAQRDERKRGDARGLYDDSKKYLDELMLNYSGKLQNDRQRELFKSLAYSRREDILSTVDRYQKDEVEAFDFESSINIGIEAVRNGAENLDDPQAREAAMVGIDIAVGAYPPERQEVERQKLLDSLHRQTMDQYHARDDEKGAAAYFEKYKSEFLGDIDPIQEKLKANTKAQQALDESLKLQGMGLSDAEELDYIDKNFKDDAQLHAAVRQLTLARHEQDQRLLTQEQKVRYDAETKNLNQMKDSGASYDQAWSYILKNEPNGEVQKQLISWANSLWNPDANKEEPNWEKVFEARRAIDNGEIGSEEQLFREYGPFLGKKLEETLKYYRDGGGAANVKDTDVRNMYKYLTGSDLKDKKDIEQYERMWGQLQQWLPKDRAVSDDELRQLMSRQLAGGEQIRGGFFQSDPNMSYSEALDKGLGDQWLPDIPNDVERQKVDAAIDRLNATRPRAYQIEKNEMNRRKFYKENVMKIKGGDKGLAFPASYGGEIIDEQTGWSFSWDYSTSGEE